MLVNSPECRESVALPVAAIKCGPGRPRMTASQPFSVQIADDSCASEANNITYYMMTVTADLELSADPRTSAGPGAANPCADLAVIATAVAAGQLDGMV